MINMIKAEIIKEKRTANRKLQLIVLIIFVVFNILMVSLMGESPAGKSYIMATAFNWYPITILPVVLSLLVVNIVSKEKDQHLGYQRSINLSAEKVLLVKNLLVIFELFMILILSSIAIYAVGVIFFQDKITIQMLSMATFCLFMGSLPIVAWSFLLTRFFSKRLILILMNFLLTLFSAYVAVTPNWKFYPWAYNLRILSPVIAVHPNSTFLSDTSPLMNINTCYLGLGLSLLVYVVITLVGLFVERKSYV